ncbi:MAG: 3-dehydro-L-gulonate 2-dehydrogenase [Ignavibacteriales bacterium]|nr:3-dehydro-L-gulonate 2-dehydrogenase [Ignavibacteriales bacterium]
MEPKKQNSIEIIRIPFEQMMKEFERILRKYYFTEEKSKILARIFTESSLDGIYTHGVNRFYEFIIFVNQKCIFVHAEPEKINSIGAVEQFNGNLGPGPLNALKCTDRSMELAKEFGIGCVALSNTNHWMRGGTYGWRAAKAGFVFIGWTNTTGIMPAWGAVDSRLGNNPIVFGVPFNNEAIVIDMALSQFSYGKLEIAKMKGEPLGVPGGYNKDGILTMNADEILESKRPLPIGYWKGAGLSLLLDLLATVLSGGYSTHEISKHKYEHGISQVFITIDLSKLGVNSAITNTIDQIIDDYHNSTRDSESLAILYPGERVLKTRNENLLNGIPVNRIIWDKILTL